MLSSGAAEGPGPSGRSGSFGRSEFAGSVLIEGDEFRQGDRPPGNSGKVLAFLAPRRWPRADALREGKCRDFGLPPGPAQGLVEAGQGTGEHGGEPVGIPLLEILPAQVVRAEIVHGRFHVGRWLQPCELPAEYVV